VIGPKRLATSNNGGIRPLMGQMLQGLEGLHTKYVCGDCGQTLLHCNNFDKREARTLVANLTGSCPNCRKLLSFTPENIRFLVLSAKPSVDVQPKIAWSRLNLSEPGLGVEVPSRKLTPFPIFSGGIGAGRT